MATRSSGPVLDPDLVFPECSSLTTHLPDNKTVIGLIKFHLKDGSSAEAIRRVSKLIYAKWKHDTVYCIALEAVVKKVTKFWSIYKEGVMQLRAGREKSSAVQKYKEMVENKKALFEIFPDIHARRLKCEDE